MLVTYNRRKSYSVFGKLAAMYTPVYIILLKNDVWPIT